MLLGIDLLAQIDSYPFKNLLLRNYTSVNNSFIFSNIMSDNKLRSDEVPQKFAEWLLAMGCPPENVPPLDKVAEMSRGQYYMVWRSLIEKVEGKDAIRNKRLQVFCDDMKKCKKKTAFNEGESNTIMPEELSLWNQHTELKEKVNDAEARVTKDKETLHQLMDKVSSKLSHRHLSYKRLHDAQRRAWFLHQVAEELREKRTNLMETKTIAESLCRLDDGADIESKLDKCVTALSRYGASANSKPTGVSLISAANPATSSSIASNHSESNDAYLDCAEEVISSLVKRRGDVLFKQLYERRARLCAAIPASQHDKTEHGSNRVTPQSVVCHTAALHCTIALAAMKNRVLIKNTSDRLATTVEELSHKLSNEACELFVIRCERARNEAHITAMRAACEEITTRTGIFAIGSQQSLDDSAAKQIHSVDKAIETKHKELRRIIISVATLERKTQNVQDCLVSLFNGFHDGPQDGERLSGRPSIPQDSILNIRQYYEEKSDIYKNKMELSMDFDKSEYCSFNDDTDNSNLKFIDELKFYLKKFNLEKNRKIVLENGEKIWVFETLQSLLEQLRGKWQSDDITTSLLCPSVSLKQSLRRLARDCARKAELEEIVKALESSIKKTAVEIDITSTTDDEQKILDKVKKRLNENMMSLQKTNKTLDVGMENLQLWSTNSMRKYISPARSVYGKTLKQYEDNYLESLQI